MKKITIILSLIFICGTASAKIQETRWQPDTCSGCVVYYTWDDSVPLDHRTTTFSRIENPPIEFKDLKPEEQYSKILEENQRKNKTYAAISENVPEAVDEIKDSDGKITKVVKNFKYHFDADRNLIVSADGLEKIDLGVEKVNVE